MSLKPIQTSNAPAAVGPYSQAIQAGPWLFLSGQIALAPGSSELVSEDFADQAKQVLKNIQAVLEASGYALEDVVAVDAFLVDLGQFQAFNEIYAGFFSKHKPARAAIGVRALPKGAQIELKCVAYKESNS